MKRLFCMLFLTFLFVGTYSNNRITHVLAEQGYENIRVAEIDDVIYIGVEDNNYRNSYMGVAKAIKVILASMSEMDTMSNLEIVFSKNNLPQLHIALTSDLVDAYSKKICSFSSVLNNAVIDFATDKPWKKLQKSRVRAFDRSAWKVDLVLYPQITLGNHNTEDSWYNYSVAFSPAVQMQLWKGASFTAQVVLPIAENLGGEVSKVRPGVIALAQNFDLGAGFKSKLSVGNFTTNRMGGVLDLLWRSKNGRIELSANGGMTVESLITDEEGWRISDKRRTTGSLAASYYVAPMQTMLKLSVNKHINGDNSVRADLQRHFLNYTIGFWGVYVEKDVNCGFNFSCPLFPRHSNHNKGFRVRPARSWEMEYSMKSLYKKDGGYDFSIGKVFFTSPESRSQADFMQPDYIRYYVAKYGELLK